MVAMLALSIVIQGLGLLKSSIVAADFGASNELDALNYVTSLFAFVSSFVSNGMVVAILPAYLKDSDRKGIDSFATLLFTLALIASLFLVFFSEPIARMTTNRAASFVGLVGVLVVPIAVSQTVSIALGLTLAYYQAHKRFNTPKMALLLNNTIVVVLLLVLKDVTIITYAKILAAGSIVQFMIDVFFAVRLGFRFSPKFCFASAEAKRLLRVYLPTTIGAAIYSIATLVDSVLSSNLDVGSLTILTYANMIVGLVNTLIIGNMSNFFYPRIIADIENAGRREAQNRMWKYSIVLQTAVCAIIVLFIAGGRELIALLLQHGEFTEEASSEVFSCMALYLFSQQFNITRDLIYRFFYACDDTVTTMRNGIVVSGLNIVLSIVFAFVLGIGVYGIVLGTVLSGMYSLAGIVFQLKKKETLSDLFPVALRSSIKLCAGVIIACLGVFMLREFAPIANSVVRFVICVTSGAALFGCFSVIACAKDIRKAWA